MRLGTAVAVACVISLSIAVPSSAAAKHRQAKVTNPAAAVEKQRADLGRILTSARSRLIGLAHLPSVQSHNASACNADMAALPALARYGSSGAADIQGNLFCLGIPFTSPVSIADRAYFLRAIGTREFGVGDYQQGRVT